MTGSGRRGIALLAVWIASVSCTSTDVSGVVVSGVKEISQDAFLNDSPAGALILDVRTPAEFAAGHVPSAINIPHDQIAARLSELDSVSDRPIIVYCKSGVRAGRAASTLLDAGYTDIRHLTGDMDAWRVSGLPSE